MVPPQHQPLCWPARSPDLSAHIVGWRLVKPALYHELDPLSFPSPLLQSRTVLARSRYSGKRYLGRFRLAPISPIVILHPPSILRIARHHRHNPRLGQRLEPHIGRRRRRKRLQRQMHNRYAPLELIPYSIQCVWHAIPHIDDWRLEIAGRRAIIGQKVDLHPIHRRHRPFIGPGIQLKFLCSRSFQSRSCKLSPDILDSLELLLRRSPTRPNSLTQDLRMRHCL